MYIIKNIILLFSKNRKKNEYKIKLYDKIEHNEQTIMKLIRSEVFDIYYNGLYLLYIIFLKLLL